MQTQGVAATGHSYIVYIREIQSWLTGSFCDFHQVSRYVSYRDSSIAIRIVSWGYRIVTPLFIFPPFWLVVLSKRSALIKARLTTMNGVVLLQKDTEPPFLWIMLFLINNTEYSRTCLGRHLVWTATRLGRPQSPARIVSNNKVPGVSDHLPDATSDRVVWFNQR